MSEWKQIELNEITDSREFPFFIQSVTADRQSQDERAVPAIEKIAVANTNHLSDFCFKTDNIVESFGAHV